MHIRIFILVLIEIVLYISLAFANVNPGLQPCKNAMNSIFGLEEPLLNCIKYAVKHLVLFDFGSTITSLPVTSNGVMINEPLPYDVVSYYGSFLTKVSRDKVPKRFEFCYERAKGSRKNEQFYKCMEDTLKFGDDPYDILISALYLHRQDLSIDNDFVHSHFNYAHDYLEDISKTIKLKRGLRVEDTLNPEQYCYAHYKPIEM